MTQSDASPLPAAVDELWWRRDELSPADTEARAVVVSAVDMLDSGKARVAEVSRTGEVVVDERARRAVMLAFRVLGMARSQVGDFHHHDRVPLKTSVEGVRVVPGAIARWGSYLAPGVVLMPSFVDIGAHVDEGSTVGTWAWIGAGAQIGRNVRLSGGAGVGDTGGPDGAEGSRAAGGPPGTVPVVVEDDALIGGRTVIVDGARVGRGAVVGAGTILSGSTPVVDVRTGEELDRGRVPDWCVATGGTRWREFPGGGFGLRCVLVLERLEEGHRPGRAELDRLLHE
ncbi:2,3,4,5-tetrahydropyridine-2,6-dicarboxylate N-succinyltransferase [Streptosporangium sp. NPDC048865]|uniref:2,3,4,5-tetrahydropyridine-2,6-dicarboxylate N-succinyltransferase n=1 Tax=Streptosporangium sp. NPDC048865 TaxID=3155766 RepID=UPI00343330F9